MLWPLKRIAFDGLDAARVVEIGPGLGALTFPLLEVTSHLHVIEIDRDIVARLRGTCSENRLTIHEGDALAFDL